MKIDLSELARTPGVHASHEFEEPLGRDPDLELLEPARGRFTVTNTGGLLVLRGQMTATVSLPCSRCCEPVAVALEVPLSEEFSARPPAPGNADARSAPLTIDEAEPERAAYRDYVLDLTELVRQNIIIAVPMQVLCDQLCPGMCPRCGANLRAGPCACPPQAPGGPLADLRRLIQPREEEE